MKTKPIIIAMFIGNMLLSLMTHAQSIDVIAERQRQFSQEVLPYLFIIHSPVELTCALDKEGKFDKDMDSYLCDTGWMFSLEKTLPMVNSWLFEESSAGLDRLLLQPVKITTRTFLKDKDKQPINSAAVDAINGSFAELKGRLRALGRNVMILDGTETAMTMPIKQSIFSIFSDFYFAISQQSIVTLNENGEQNSEVGHPDVRLFPKEMYATNPYGGLIARLNKKIAADVAMETMRNSGPSRADALRELNTLGNELSARAGHPVADPAAQTSGSAPATSGRDKSFNQGRAALDSAMDQMAFVQKTCADIELFDGLVADFLRDKIILPKIKGGQTFTRTSFTTQYNTVAYRCDYSIEITKAPDGVFHYDGKLTTTTGQLKRVSGDISVSVNQ